MSDKVCKHCGEAIRESPSGLTKAQLTKREWKRKQAGEPAEGYIIDRDENGVFYLCLMCAHWRYWAKKIAEAES